MTVYVFVGPTLPAAEARAELDAVYLPPVAQGDVYRVAIERPKAIGIIDGYFERVPSVWHKEILWAMSQGIHVFGAASMGALRAAELAPFGMEGVGEVFEAFRSGAIEDDDEVAVTHAAQEQGYRLLSDAMVNIRASLAAACARGVIGEWTRKALERLAKGLFYQERSYPALLALAEREGVPAGEVEALREWLPAGRVDQKRLDALVMLKAMRAHLSAGLGPKRVGYTFERTSAWDEMQRQAGRSLPGGAKAPGAALQDALLDELRQVGGHERARLGALARALALELARRQGRVVGREAMQEAIDAFRRERGLLKVDDFVGWLRAERLEDVERFFREEAQVRWAEAVLEPDVARCLPDYLRGTGELRPLLARVEEKRCGASGG